MADPIEPKGPEVTPNPEPLDPTGGEPTPGNVDDPIDPPADPAPADPTVDDPPADPPDADKKGGVQKKIDKLTKRAADADRDAAYWKGVAEGKKETPTPVAITTETGLKPENFSSYEDFVQAVAKNAATVAGEEIRQKAEKKDEQDRQQKVQEQYAEARKVHEDFDEVVIQPSSLPINQGMMDAAMGENLGEIMYFLAKNQSKASQIMTLPPLQAAREIGKIEAQITQKKPIKTKSNAPPPVTTLGGGSSDSVSDDKKSQKNLYAKWDKTRKERLGA